MTNEESKVEVVGEYESSVSESSLGATEKVEIEKELEALMERANDQAIELDKTLEEGVVQDPEKNWKRTELKICS